MTNKERKRIWRLKQGMKPRTDPEIRFWEKVEKTKTCWLWISGIDKKGYGRFDNNGNIQAHRFSYELVNGKIPAGLTIDHLCRIRNCVNPKHLEAVSNKENCLRGFGPTAINKRKINCPKCGGVFTKRSDGGRSCVPCLKRYHIEYHRRTYDPIKAKMKYDSKKRRERTVRERKVKHP